MFSKSKEAVMYLLVNTGLCQENAVKMPYIPS